MSRALKIVQKFFPTVTSVRDTANHITVTVTKRDCQSRAVRNHTECALARACKREMGLDGALIAIRTAYLVKGRKAIRCGIAENTSREIVAFDRNGDFAPGEYELVRPFSQLGSPRSSASSIRKGGTNKKPGKSRRMTSGIRHGAQLSTERNPKHEPA